MDCVHELSGSSLGSWSGVVGKVKGRTCPRSLFSRTAFCCQLGALCFRQPKLTIAMALPNWHQLAPIQLIDESLIALQMRSTSWKKHDSELVILMLIFRSDMMLLNYDGCIQNWARSCTPARFIRLRLTSPCLRCMFVLRCSLYPIR